MQLMYILMSPYTDKIVLLTTSLTDAADIHPVVSEDW